MLKSKDFELPIYSCRVIFVYSTLYNDIIKFAKEQDFDDYNQKEIESKDYHGINCVLEDKNHKYYYIIVKKKKDKYEELDTITHEISHGVCNILESKGISINESGNEPYAYLTGYLNKEFFKFKDGK